MGNTNAKKSIPDPDLYAQRNQAAFEISPKSPKSISPRLSVSSGKAQNFHADALPTVFRWNDAGQNVAVAGSFNDWKPIPMSRSQDDFFAIIELPEGVHEFKFWVDGIWRHDPSQRTVPNAHGTVNNFVEVKRQDFEVFEALALDESTSKHSNSGIKSPMTSSPSGDYNQEIPSRSSYETFGVMQPPQLPPALLQVILNKDISIQCEPALLPEPNHVMINHLYALSIKDGVMVLSSTHRYRQKFVTTLLYKPI